MQQWLPAGDEEIQASVAKALTESFHYVRVFRSVEHQWGFHFLASDRPIPQRNAVELLQRMPQKAIQDMMEWGPYKTPEDQLSAMLTSELSPDLLVAESPRTPAMQDNLPVNEYFLLRVLERGEMCRSKFGGACQNTGVTTNP